MRGESAADRSFAPTAPAGVEEERTDEVTLRSFALAAVASLVGDSEAPEVRFLLGQRRAVTAEAESWADGLEDYLRRPAGADGHLLHLAQELDLTAVEV